ncbi:MAG: hypothetical protein WBG48_07535 [Pricia sp.]
MKGPKPSDTERRTFWKTKMKTIFPHYSVGHFINQLNNPTYFEITHFERMKVPNVEPSHKHTFYEILWTEAGTSKQIIDYKDYRCTRFQTFICSVDINEP